MEGKQEEWKDVIGYERYYQVSSFGRVKSLDREVAVSRGGSTLIQLRKGGLKTLLKDRLGYMRVKLSKRGKSKVKLVHRLVCEAFKGPSKGIRTYVNHENSKRDDNRVGNLTWCSHAENMKHAGTKGLCLRGGDNPNAKRIVNCRGQEFNSITEAAESCGLKSMSSISNVLSGYQKTAGKYADGSKISWREITSE